MQWHCTTSMPKMGPLSRYGTLCDQGRRATSNIELKNLRRCQTHGRSARHTTNSGLDQVPLSCELSASAI
jgi:hypothetical protein